MSIRVLPLSWATTTLGMTKGSECTLGRPSMHGKRVGNDLFLAQGLLGFCEAGFCTALLFLMSDPVLHSHLLIPIPRAPPAPCLRRMKTEPATSHGPNHGYSSRGASQPGAKQAASRTVTQAPSPWALCPSPHRWKVISGSWLDGVIN